MNLHFEHAWSGQSSSDFNHGFKQAVFAQHATISFSFFMACSYLVDCINVSRRLWSSPASAMIMRSRAKRCLGVILEWKVSRRLASTFARLVSTAARSWRNGQSLSKHPDSRPKNFTVVSAESQQRIRNTHHAGDNVLCVTRQLQPMEELVPLFDSR